MSKYLRVIGEYGLCLLILVLVLLAYSGIGQFSLSAPLKYSNDALAVMAWIKLYVGQVLFNTPIHIAYPNGFIVSDFPNTDLVHIWMLLGLAKLYLTDNPIVLANAFYLLSFVTVAFSALFSLRHLKLNYPLALAGALVFTFLPYHFYRGTNHLFLASYFVVPFYGLVAVKLYTIEMAKLTSVKAWLCLLLLAFLFAGCGIYYTFFGCGFLLISTLLARVNKQTKNLCWLASLFALIALCLLLQLLPSLFTAAGNNLAAMIRVPAQVETYGLRIAHLLLPADYHRFGILANLSKHYNQLFSASNNESTYAHLGIISSLGFIYLILILFIAKPSANNKLIRLFALLNLAALLYACVGGFAALLAFLGLDIIRSVNRISVFIAFFALSGLLILIQQQLHQYQIRRGGYWLCGLFLIMFSGFDQIPPAAFNNQILALKESYDREFMLKINKLMPRDSAIFELPSTDFPEPEKMPGRMFAYEPYIPYLYTQNLYWSYGASKGRAVAKWQAMVAAMSSIELLKQLAYAGYTGVLIDTRGYSDHAKLISSEFRQLTQTQGLISFDQQWIFFDLRNYVNRLKHSQALIQWQCNLKRSKVAMQISPVMHKGLVPSAMDVNQNTLRWWASAPEVIISFNNLSELKTSVDFNLFIPDASGNMKIILNKQEIVDLSFTHQLQKVNLGLLPGKNVVEFKAKVPAVAATGSLLKTYFALSDFVINLAPCQ